MAGTKIFADVAEHLNGTMEKWSRTDFLHASKNFGAPILKSFPAERDERPYVSPEDLQNLRDLELALSDQSCLGEMKDEYVLSLFSVSNLLMISQDVSKPLHLDQHAAVMSLDSYVKKTRRDQMFAISVRPRFVFWKPMLTSEDFSVESRKRLREMAFEQFKPEYFHNRLRQTLQCQKKKGEKKAAKSKILLDIRPVSVFIKMALESPDNISLNRIDTQSVKSTFGMMRMVLRNDLWLISSRPPRPLQTSIIKHSTNMRSNTPNAVSRTELQ
jgi:hypothetical protein